jgi:hypothetical protein
MIRSLPLIAAVWLVACTTPPRPLEDSTPVSIDGWTRTDVAQLPASEVPETIRQIGPEQSISATYKKESSASVKIFRMKTQTSAFELIQKWRQTEGLAAYSGAYFIVAESNAPPDAAALLQALQKHFK